MNTYPRNGATCPGCGGSGDIIQDMPDGSSKRHKCSTCNGSGRV
jgi:DnaJ-class molecular chaperone